MVIRVVFSGDRFFGGWFLYRSFSQYVFWCGKEYVVLYWN